MAPSGRGVAGGVGGTWVIQVEHTGVGGQGGRTWVIRAEHTGILTKNPILIGFYIFLHRIPNPSELGGTLLYRLFIPFDILTLSFI